MDTGLFHKDYFDHTVLNPLGLVAVVVLGLLLLILPRRYAPYPMLVMACFVAPAQRIIVVGMNFDLLRVMGIFGVTRICGRGEILQLKWRPIDSVFLCWSLVSAIMFLVQLPTFEAIKWKSGQLYDQLGLYFLFRCLIRNTSDINAIAKFIAVLSMLVCVAMLDEYSTGRNLFSIFGGLSEMTPVREGRLRCQGAFAHPIIAGCFWAAQVPIIASLWWNRNRTSAILGVISSLMIVILSASSTPAAAVGFAILGGFAYFVRHHLKWLCWSALSGAVLLHLLMKAPLWHLIARVDLAGGSTGWHRFNLIQQTIDHLGEWWLYGSSDVASWGVYNGDVTNHFILEGMRGGLISMALFCVVIYAAFEIIGRLWRRCEAQKLSIALPWAVGVSLFVHVTSFLGVSYFGQIIVVWYMLLAMIASLDESLVLNVFRMRNAGRSRVQSVMSSISWASTPSKHSKMSQAE